MRSRSRTLAILTIAAGISLIPTAASAERTQSDLVIVRPEDVVSEDLYAAGNAIRIEGRVEGDLYAVAFNDVTISGEVTGDVVVAADRLEVTGTVGGSVRGVATTVVVGGSVGDDVLVAAWSTLLESTGVVERDLLSWSSRVGVDGRIGRNLEGQARTITMAGTVEGAMEVIVGELSLTEDAMVGGDLIYQSESEAELSGAEIGGSIIQRTALPPNVRLRGLRLLTFFLAFLGIAALAMAMTWVWPGRVEAAAHVARRWVRTWLAGMGIVVSPLVAGGVLALLVALSPSEAGLPLALVLLPLVLGLGGIVVMAGVIGLVPVAGLLGRLVIRERSVAAAVLAGLLGLMVLFLIPIVKWIAVVALVPLGIGAWIRHLDLGHDLPAT
ncbi:MAG TPA: hypothetical protein VM470_05770 [Acidimicrobiia bacterium]|nr:hypothetical protein [Acidimicrobiia bacterium]